MHMKDDHGLDKAPVLLFAYRKLDFLDEIYDVIRRYSPPKLYISHNFYRDEAEKDLVNAVRVAVKSWSFPFEVEYIFHEKHYFINDVFYNVLDDVFSREESLIVLEDDIIPSSSFFPFCNSMLARYRNSAEVGSIVGCNLDAVHQKNTFFHSPFSIFYWGWATWSSRWNLLRQAPLPWGSDDNGVIEKLSGGQSLFAPFIRKLDSRLTWDVRWGWAQALNNQRCVLPGVNLVSNKGFMPQGSYTNFTESRFKHLEVFDLQMEQLELLDDSGSNAAYENRSAELLGEILEARGELEYYRA